MRLIDAYAVHCDRDEFDTYADYIKAFDAINEAPTVDAEPVRHGKWIEHEWAEESEGLLIPNYECSECHTWERNESDYCPKCGARMDAE